MKGTSVNSLEPERVELDDIANIIESYRRAVIRAQEAENDVKNLRGLIEDKMGSAESGLVGGRVVVTWRNVTSRRIDTDAVKKHLGDNYEQFTKVSTSRRFEVAAPEVQP